MPMSAAIPRSNNFDVLRLTFASMVVLYHCYDLSGEHVLRWIPLVCSAKLAVEGFFAMSGCLIVASYENSTSFLNYIEKRARRILPAYWLALVFTLLIGCTFTSFPILVFLKSLDTWKYTLANLTFLNFLHPSLPGLFVHNPVMDSVNGSLWTIKIEVMFYLFVPLLVYLCRRYGRWQALAGVFLSSLLYKSTCEHFHHASLALQLPAQLGYFAIGALFYYYYPWFSEYGGLIWVSAFSSYAVYLLTDWNFFRVTSISFLVLCAGLLFPMRKGRIKSGDLSYGIYVLHFPVIQVFLALGIFHAYPMLSVGIIAVIVAILSFASWHLVEKRYLLKSWEKRQMVQPTMTRV
jgi:peptidoglycan/LPS O-acetylase OafA/YrhL